MSGLREALEKLALEAGDTAHGTELGHGSEFEPECPRCWAEEIRGLVAAHPVGPAPSDYSQEEIAAKIADRVPRDMDGSTLSERLRIGKSIAPLFAELNGDPS